MMMTMTQERCTDMAEDPRPPTEAEALFMMIGIVLVLTITLNSIVYWIVG